MDNEAPCRGDSKEQIREKLIAISESIPETPQDSTHAPEVPEGANGTVKNEEAADKLRSNLISISYEESTEEAVAVPKPDARPNGQP